MALDLLLEQKVLNNKMIKLKEQNINTEKHWDQVFKKEIENETLRIDFERFERTEKMIKENSEVIDIGCGRGEFLEYLLKQKPSCHVLGIDFSKIAIKDAKTRISNAEFADTNLYKLADYKSLLEKFDYAVCFEVI
jgi:2-polyprenyl-3-methyl-5-hydroxy-6-metoxy-1,4-benzoquinol methylase